MKSQLKMLAIIATCASLVNFESLPAVAQPLSIVPTAAAVAPVAKSGIEQVRYRNGGRYRGGNYQRGGQRATAERTSL
jgi:hypothetical protein